jgi:RNA polymerase sigma-70 factor (ECF subfamily)
VTSSREALLAAAYQQARPRLVRVAYAVLGTHAEAEDVVSDCWLRLAAADARDPVLDVEAWATVTVARAALDALRSARRRREVYVGPWLPEPVVGLEPVAGAGPPPPDPADRVTLDETLSYAMLVVLETLTPAERTAWVLHDVFGLPFTGVAEAVGRTPAAVRQLAARARAHISAKAPRVEVGAAEHSAAVTRFLDAALGGDLSALVGALDPDVVLTTDGGGMVSAARHPVRGAGRVARFIEGIARWVLPGDQVQIITVNGLPGLGVVRDGQLSTVVSLTMTGGRITRIDFIRAPGKLPALP